MIHENLVKMLRYARTCDSKNYLTWDENKIQDSKCLYKYQNKSLNDNI